MGDSADFARRRPEIERQFKKDRARESAEFEAKKAKKKPGLFSRIVNAPVRAVDALVDTPFERDRPKGKSGGVAKAVKVGGKVSEAVTKAAVSQYDPREYVRMAKGAAKGNKLDQVALAMSVIPIVKFNPNRFIRAAEIMDNSPQRAIKDLRRFAEDPHEYAFQRDWDRHTATWGEPYDESEIGESYRRAVKGFQNDGTLHLVQRRAEDLADKLERTRIPKPGLPKGMHPADMTPGEFVQSDFPVWHSTESAPGLGREGIHAGTLGAAFDRAIAKASMGSSRTIKNTRFIPIVLRGKKAGPLRDDPGSDFPLPTNGQSFRFLDPRMMVHRRADAEGDVIPYINSVEDPGQVSVQVVNPVGARTHLDVIRDYIAETGQVPRGLSGYRFADVIEAMLRKQIAAARRGGDRVHEGISTEHGLARFAPSGAQRNANFSSTRAFR